MLNKILYTITQIAFILLLLGIPLILLDIYITRKNWKQKPSKSKTQIYNSDGKIIGETNGK